MATFLAALSRVARTITERLQVAGREPQIRPDFDADLMINHEVAPPGVEPSTKILKDMRDRDPDAVGLAYRHDFRHPAAFLTGEFIANQNRAPESLPYGVVATLAA